MRFVPDAALPKLSLSPSAATNSLAVQSAGAGDSVSCMHALCFPYAAFLVGFLEKKKKSFPAFCPSGAELASRFQRIPCKRSAPEKERASNQNMFLEDAWGRCLPGTPNPAFYKFLTPTVGSSHLEVGARNPKDLSAPS